MNIRLLPPTEAALQTCAFKGRSYSAAPGSVIDVYDADAATLQANGWIYVAPSGPTSSRPTGTLGPYSAASRSDDCRPKCGQKQPGPFYLAHILSCSKTVCDSCDSRDVLFALGVLLSGAGGCALVHAPWNESTVVLKFHIDWKKTNNYAGNCCGGCDPRSRYFSLDCHPFLLIAGLLFAWGLEPKRTEEFIGRIPYGNYVLKALFKLDGIISGWS
jgi:hypothetical protein